MELLNIRFNFLRRSRHTNGDGHSPIVLRVIYRSRRKDVYTGIYCNKQNRDPTSQKMFSAEKDRTSFNKNPGLILHRAHDCFGAVLLESKDLKRIGDIMSLKKHQS
jgi:hypothetical protein